MIKITHIQGHQEQKIAKQIAIYLQTITDEYFEVKVSDGTRNLSVIKKTIVNDRGCKNGRINY